jgi:hypothetical protein
MSTVTIGGGVYSGNISNGAGALLAEQGTGGGTSGSSSGNGIFGGITDFLRDVLGIYGLYRVIDSTDGKGVPSGTQYPNSPATPGGGVTVTPAGVGISSTMIIVVIAMYFLMK